MKSVCLTQTGRQSHGREERFVEALKPDAIHLRAIKPEVLKQWVTLEVLPSHIGDMRILER